MRAAPLVFIATSWQRSPDPGHFHRAMELPPDWTPRLSRHLREAMVFDDGREAAGMTFPRGLSHSPPSGLPATCEVFELDSGTSEVEQTAATRRRATTAQNYSEMDSDTSLFETATDHRFAARSQEPTSAPGGGHVRQGVAGLHAPGSLRKDENEQKKVIPNGSGFHGKGGRAADRQDRPPKEFHGEPGQANFDFYMDSKNDKYQGHREVPGPSSGPRRQLFECLTCGHTTHVEDISGLWICSTCRKMRPPDTNRPSKHETPTGTWMYMPHPPSHPGASNPPSRSPGFAPNAGRPKTRPRRRRRHGGPPTDDGLPDEEQAESERLTHDPSVEPSLMDGDGGQLPDVPRHDDGEPRRNLRQVAAGGRTTDEQMLELLRRLARQDGHSDTQSWSSMKGPGPGIKFRGGAPPSAPVWRYQSNDVRAYEKYERKVRMWRLQVKQYMSAAEAGLALYSSLQGEAEQQLEFVELDMIFHKGGVDFILEQLKNAFQQKTVYVKRHHLHEYENMARYPQESIRAYTNRYKRVEAALKAIGVDISLTYDAEARGSRLLDRARLSGEQQRMILVGTNGQLDFNAVAAAMIMQYPDYKPAPMVVTRDGKGNQKGNQGYSSSSSSASTTASGSSTASSQSSSRRKGDGKHFDKSRRVFQTINEEADDAQDGQEEDVDEAPEEQDDDGDQENAEDGEEIEAENNEFEELAQVLTVTAKKLALASITQGRKYKNAPRKSIEQRKKETTCAACGNKGHWAGDPECEVLRSIRWHQFFQRFQGQQQRWKFVDQGSKTQERQFREEQKGVHRPPLHWL